MVGDIYLGRVEAVLPGIQAAFVDIGTEKSAFLHASDLVFPDDDAESEGDIRVVDESGEDYLYPAKWFVPVEIPQAVKSSLLRAS